jgi:aldehyde:ferredoxin oxidoreductase
METPIMYLGKIAEVDLASGNITFRDYSTEMAETCLGGLGFNSWYLYRHVPLGSALDPENVLIISCGLLTGSAAPASSRIQISARSPLSGLMGSSNVGGFFGVRLRACGIRSLILRGKSPRPVYLKVTPDAIEIKDAGRIWGLDTRETADILTVGLADKIIPIQGIIDELVDDAESELQKLKQKLSE